MEYPFRTDVDYFTPEQQKRLNKSIEIQPEAGKIFVNADGEKRKIMIVRWPHGTINHQTQFRARGAMTPGDAPDAYHTPCAKLPNQPGPHVFTPPEFEYEEKGKVHRATDEDFLDWLGDGWKADYEGKKTINNDKEALKRVRAHVKAYNEQSEDVEAEKPTEVEGTVDLEKDVEQRVERDRKRKRGRPKKNE